MNNCTKNGIVVQNSKSRISLAKAAKKVVAVQNRDTRDVTPRVVTNSDFDRINSILESQIHELNELGGFLTELKKAKLSLSSLLELLVRKQITLGNSLKI